MQKLLTAIQLTKGFTKAMAPNFATISTEKLEITSRKLYTAGGNP